jgi:DNA-binding transcriptional LysR family regulator
VIDEGYDAVVRSGEVEDSRLTSRLLGRFRMLVVGTPDYFARRGKPAHPRDLSRHACIQFRMPNSGKLQVWQLRRDADEPEIQLATTVTCNTNEARLCFALEGLGVAHMSDFSVRIHNRSQHLPVAVAIRQARHSKAAGVHRLRQRARAARKDAGLMTTTPNHRESPRRHHRQ